MANEQVTMIEHAVVAAQADRHDDVRWRAHMRLDKYDEDGRLYETIERDGNLLMTAGATALWTLLIGGGGTTWANANAHIGVGDSSTAAAAGQTDLQASTNKLRKAMEATYPQVSTNTCVFRASFGSSEANFAWAEWAVFNASSAGTMLNRKVESLGTKASGSTWVLTVTLSLA